MDVFERIGNSGLLTLLSGKEDIVQEHHASGIELMDMHY